MTTRAKVELLLLMLGKAMTDLSRVYMGPSVTYSSPPDAFASFPSIEQMRWHSDKLISCAAYIT